MPEGNWTNYFTGEKKQGGCWYQEFCGYMSIPAFVRENSLVAVGARDDRPDYDYADNVTIKAYELKEGKETSTVVFSMDGSEETKVSVLKTDGYVHICVESEKPCWILFVGEHFEAGVGTVTEEGTLISFKKGGKADFRLD